MNKRSKEALNMFFSAFIVAAYVICCYFILRMSEAMTSQALQTGVSLFLVVVFGVMLFYATRVGDGKQVIRFSPSVLIMIVLPALYVLCAFFAVGLPLHTQVSSNIVIVYLAAVSLGYGVPYSFTSGFELVDEEDVLYPERSEGKDKTKNNKNNKKNNNHNKKK